MNLLKLIFILTLALINPLVSLNSEELILKNNMERAQPGDYIVVSVNKTETLFLIYAKKFPLLTIEEIAFPESKKPLNLSWQEWINQGAPGNTSWIRYEIDLQTGKMIRYYSFTKKNWFEIPERDFFLSKLLNLKLTQIPENARKRVGPAPRSGPEIRPFWQPRMIVEGRAIDGVLFDAWRTRWPTDGTDLSGKMIEIYLPKDSQRYPAYFPYWLQINGVVGKAKIRIVDSGKQLRSSKESLPEMSY